MGFGKKLVLITVLVSIAAIVYEVVIKENPKIPDYFFEDRYWGRKVLKADEPLPEDSTKIRKFEVQIEDSVIKDIKHRLQNTRYVEPLPGTHFTYGFNGDELKKIVDYWIKTYDWRKQEKELNKYNHFKTEIEGLDIHFIHVKPEKAAKHTLPLLIVHGWPGSFYEYYKSIPLLTAVENDVAFELIIPSIPGFGFSEAPHKPGFGPVNAARILKKLMNRLGHKEYYYHGSDWGSIIGRYISAMYPDDILGYHTTMPGIVKLNFCSAIKFAFAYFIPSLFSDNPSEEMKRLKPFTEKILFFALRESGYLHLQATKPDSVSVALLNSPAGLAAYILDKFATFTNREYVNLPDGGLTKHFTYDELITIVMLYWDSIHSSVRMYKESNAANNIALREELEEFPIVGDSIPVGVSIPSHDTMYFPQILAKQAFRKLLHYNFLPRGGHFVAFEEPQLIVTEIRIFVAKCLDFYEQKEKQRKHK